MTGLERLVEANLNAITGGTAHIALGKRHPGRGGTRWDMLVIYTSKAGLIEYADIRRLITDDKNTVLFQSAGRGSRETVKDIAKRLKNVYESRNFRATHEDVDVLMPPGLYEEMTREEQIWKS